MEEKKEEKKEEIKEEKKEEIKFHPSILVPLTDKIDIERINRENLILQSMYSQFVNLNPNKFYNLFENKIKRKYQIYMTWNEEKKNVENYFRIKNYGSNLSGLELRHLRKYSEEDKNYYDNNNNLKNEIKEMLKKIESDWNDENKEFLDKFDEYLNKISYLFSMNMEGKKFNISITDYSYSNFIKEECKIYNNDFSKNSFYDLLILLSNQKDEDGKKYRINITEDIQNRILNSICDYNYNFYEEEDYKFEFINDLVLNLFENYKNMTNNFKSCDSKRFMKILRFLIQFLKPEEFKKIIDNKEIYETCYLDNYAILMELFNTGKLDNYTYSEEEINEYIKKYLRDLFKYKTKYYFENNNEELSKYYDNIKNYGITNDSYENLLNANDIIKENDNAYINLKYLFSKIRYNLNLST